MALEITCPNMARFREVSGTGYVDALQLCLEFAPPIVSSPGDVESSAVKHRHAENVARPRLSILVKRVHVGLRGKRIEVELEHLLERSDLSSRGCLSERLEPVDDPVPSGEENPVLAADLRHRGRGPRRVKNRRRDVLPCACEQTTTALVENDKTRGVRSANLPMRVVHPSASVEVEVVASNEDRTVCCVMRPDPGSLRQVEEPDDVGIERPRLKCRSIRRGHLPPFGSKRAVVTVGEPLHIETQNLAPIVDDIRTLAFDGRGRRNTAVGPVEEPIFAPLRHDELPVNPAVALIQAEEHAAITDVLRIARTTVIRADEYPTAGYDWSRVGLSAELDDPTDVRLRVGIEGIDKPGL